MSCVGLSSLVESDRVGSHFYYFNLEASTYVLNLNSTSVQLEPPMSAISLKNNIDSSSLNHFYRRMTIKIVLSDNNNQWSTVDIETGFRDVYVKICQDLGGLTRGDHPL